MILTWWNVSRSLSETQHFRDTLRQSVYCVECVSLSPCFVYPCWILWLRTSGFTNCRELLLRSHGYSGEIPCKYVLCCTLVFYCAHPSQRSDEFHVRKILSRETRLYGTACPVRPCVSAAQPALFFFLRELPQEAPLRPFQGSQHSIRENGLNEALGVYMLAQGQMWPHRKKSAGWLNPK